MKQYEIVYVDEHNTTNRQLVTEDDIVDQYWDYWYDMVCRKYGKQHVDTHYNRNHCIAHWCIVSWAVEFKPGTKLTPGQLRSDWVYDPDKISI